MSKKKSPRKSRVEKPQNNGRTVRFKCAIARLRKERKLTLRQVADGADVNNAVVSTVERGTAPRLDIAFKLAQFFDLPIDKIWTPTKSSPKMKSKRA